MLWRFSLGCLLGIIACGCQLPGSSSGDLPEPNALASGEPAKNIEPTVGNALHGVPAITAGNQPLDASDALNLSDISQEEAMLAVLDGFQQIGARDPEAQQLLLDQLRQARPSLWPLMVQQFQASEAYRQKFSKPSPARPFHGKTSVANERASSELGVLVDPRRIRSGFDSEETFARVTPASFPSPGPQEPQPFLEPAAVAIRGNDSSGDPQEVQQARLLTSPQENAKKIQPATLETNSEIANSEMEVERAIEEKNWQHWVEKGAAELERRLPESSQNRAEIHQHVSLRILQLLTGRTEEALRPIPGISSVEQDYWSAQLFTLATYLDHHRQPDDPRRAAAAAGQLEEAVSKLREMGTLSLRNLAFCKEVYDFGAYETYSSNRFKRGQPLSIYAEVENYRSQQTEQGYTTSLASSYEVLNEQGKRIDGREFPKVEDTCRRRRRDFHIQYMLDLPANIPSGKYQLQLLMKDLQSDKRGQAMIAFEIE